MKRSTIIILMLVCALLGALIAVPLVRQADKNKLLSSRYEDWLKLSVIMQKIDEMYVDSVDHAKVTDAAVTAALAALDPHSIYMLPQKLEEAQEAIKAKMTAVANQGKAKK